jgi:hypothetical protein
MEANNKKEITEVQPTNPCLLMSVKKFVATYGETFPLGSVRQYLFFRETNGLMASGAVLQIGKRKLILDVPRFMAWIRSCPSPIGDL